MIAFCREICYDDTIITKERERMPKLDKLLLLTAEGDMEAFSELYRETQRGVYAVILAILRDAQLAEDIMQNTYIRVRDNAVRYAPGTNAKAWVLTIARRLAINEWHRRQREVYVDFTENESLYGEYRSEQQFTDNIVLKTALATLEEEEREIVLLYAAGFKHREIAKSLDLPVGTVTWKYSAAIKKLRKNMAGDEKPEEVKRG